MTRHFQQAGLLLLATVITAGCPSPSPAEQVAAGVARLTFRNLGAVSTLANANTSCGFASPSVLGSPNVVGSVGSAGSITWTITDCEIDAGGGMEVSKSCDDVVVTASGKVRVSGTKTIAGTLSGVATSPVVPGGPDAVTITISKAEFTDFKVENSSSANKMTIKSGTATGVVKPRLAVAAANGACAISTPNTTFSDVTLTAAKIHLSGSSEVDAEVSAANLQAQNGVNGDKENVISGKITLSSTIGMTPPNMSAEHSIPVPGDNDKLDPDYDAGKFKSGYACTPGLASPESFVCADLTPLLATGGARLTVKAFGVMASILDKDTTCGFSANTVLGAPEVTGTPGGMGSVKFTSTACAITIPADTDVSTDCGGVKTRAGGSFTVTGTKTVSGRLTGSATQPIVPATDSPALIELTITPNNFKVGSSADGNALTIKSGTLAGGLMPRVAVASDTGACSISSPIAMFHALTYTNAVIAVTSASGTFDLPVATSNLEAVNGTWAEESNELSGTMTVGTTALTVPADGLGLNPTFAQADFDTAWQCAPGMLLPVSHGCSFVGPLAQGISRLTPRTLGTVLSIINADTTCGFSSPAVAGQPAFTGNLGDDGSTALFTIASASPCSVTFAAETVVAPATVCNTAVTSVMGTFAVSGTKSVTGYRTGDPLNPVVPTSRDPATYDLTITFTGFKVINSEATGTLTVDDGTIDAVIIPRVGLDITKGACSISTPVVTFSDITYSNANVTLVSDGKTFKLPVSASDLDAQNGTKDATSNRLTGSITVSGAPVPIPINPADNTLDPDFVQADFDASYACTANLYVAPDEATCSFKKVLAQGAARLLIKNVGIATKMVDGNAGCGFANTTVLTNPTASTGTAGEQGSIEWSVAACTIGPLADTSLGPNCVGGSNHVSGTVVATGTKTVVGLRGTNPPIIPLTRTAAEFVHTSLAFTDFVAYELAAGATAPTGKLTLTGTASAIVNPVAGESETNAGVFSISTPVTEFSDVILTNATASLVSGNATFHFTMDADLTAFNGSYLTNTNSLSGTVSIDGISFTVPVNAADPTLDPAYAQATFDATYVCTPDLVATVPAGS